MRRIVARWCVRWNLHEGLQKFDLFVKVSVDPLIELLVVLSVGHCELMCQFGSSL